MHRGSEPGGGRRILGQQSANRPTQLGLRERRVALAVVLVKLLTYALLAVTVALPEHVGDPIPDRSP